MLAPELCFRLRYALALLLLILRQQALPLVQQHLGARNRSVAFAQLSPGLEEPLPQNVAHELRVLCVSNGQGI